MKRSIRLAAAFAVPVLCAALAARADVKATVEHNSGEAATAAFKFKAVPAPAKTGAAVKAKATLVDGDKDDAARDVSSLTDGAVPTEEDQPDNNFFFNAGTEGGRVEIDLGSAVPVKQVNTYSWHASTRGPQVYKMYAADGTAPGFNAAPKKGTDPTTCGWKLVTAVDTRPKDGEPGGQYGVSVADTTGAPLGTYRYVLLDAERTETDDDFGNTFFSRVDVIPAGGATTQPAK